MINRIFEEIEKLKKRYHTKDPFELAESVGVKIRFKDLADVKGFYIVMNKSRFIVINENLDTDMQKIVFAHELGHDRLHRHFAAYNFHREHSLFDFGGRIEKEANQFTADLLISDTDMLMNLIWNKYTVEQTAMQLRLPINLVEHKVISLRNRGVF